MSESEEYESILAKINPVALTVEDFADVLDEMHRLHESGTTDVDPIFVVISLFANDEPEKVNAIYFRMQALARVISEGGAHGWTLPTTMKGRTYTRAALIEAAAMVSLSEIDGEVRFDVDALLSKALELTDAEGRG